MKKASRKVLLSFIIFILILLVACSSDEAGDESRSEDSVKDEVSIVISDDPDFLDPHYATASMTYMMILNMFEGLLAVDTDGTLEGAIAESYDISDDGLTYTFHIRDDIFFHNDEQLTANDVLYSYERLLGKDSNEPLTSELDSIKEMEVVDDFTFEVTLDEVNSNFLYMLTALNAAIIPEANDDKHNEEPIGTGPFKFVSYSPGSKLTLEKHDNYWKDDLPKLSEVNFLFQSDRDAALMSMQAGDIDIMDIPAHRIDEMEDDFSIETQEVNSALIITFNEDVEPFDDVRVRQAINYAISKDDMIDSVFSGYAAKLGSNMSPAMEKFYLDGLEDMYEQDIERAKELLKEAGYEDGFSTKITVSSHRSMYADLAQIAKENLKEIGIDLEIEVVEWGIWLDQVYTDHNYEMTAIDLTGRPSAYEILNDYISTNDNENFFRFNNEEYDEIMEEVLLEEDDDAQVELYQRAQEILAEEAAAVYIADYQFIWALHPQLEGLQYYPFYFHDMSEVYYQD